MRSVLLTLLAGLSICSAGFGGVITYSVSGTYGAGVGTNSLLGHPYTAPSASWSLSFTVDENPTPIFSSADFFEVPFSAFVYKLNGVDTGLTPSVSEIDFSDAAGFGMFDVIFDSILDSFGFTGEQMFSGTTAAPTMLTGNYIDDNSVIGPPTNPSDIDGIFLGGTNLQSNNGLTVNGSLDAAGVPEPSTFGLLIGGGLALAAMRRRRAA